MPVGKFFSMKSKLVLFSSLLIIISTLMISPTFAEQNPKIVSIDGDTKLTKTTIPMHISSDNMLPWAHVYGNVEDHAIGHPVIIQIYQNGEAVHFGQTNVDDDGSYEYIFRVKTIDGDKVINIFEGNYEVRIFKTSNLISDHLV